MSLCSVFGKLRIIGQQKNVRLKILSICYQQKFLSSKQPKQYIIKEVDPSTGQEKKIKTKIIPKITLLSGDDITVTTFEEAQSISKRRDLKLVKVTDLDSKTQRPVYKLLTANEYHSEELKLKEQKRKEKENHLIKGEKVLLVNATISKHDLDIHIKKIVKWLSKSLEVRIVINGDLNRGETVYSIMEEALKNEARFVQKRTKGSDIKFNILPPKKDKPQDHKNL